ncbi:sensor histidine kinase [Flavobacterium poyangense]|uniref:sensor histidine kinase n=1 Tax=Flavobacterium poyangense TaxID=2204302 RepID=UPI00141F7456|nr:HAMP domain-containing sensor histidine kinase [Flavobacterium sp. JXAS1]
MNKKLLNKTTTTILIYSVLILLCSAPVFYYIINQLYVEETDDTLKLHKEEFIYYELPHFSEQDIVLWNKYNRNIQIVPSKHIAKDTIFSKFYYDALEDENEPYREINAPLSIKGKSYTYTGRINLIEKEDMVYSTAKLFLILIIILLSGILLITKISSKKIWKPFYDTLKQIRSFEIDKNKKPQFLPTPIDEFTQLNSSLDRLIEKNIVIYKNQREFIENAAHELQTPLTLFQTKIDTLLQMDLSKEQSKIMTSLNKDVSRLNRLNKNLLLLSKIENTNYLDKEAFVLNNYIEKHLDFFTEQAKAKNLTIVIEFNELLKIKSNPSLTEILINNLFLNAIRHNEKNGKIIIRTQNQTLTFLNSGNSEPLITDKLFNRFSKANPSSQGNGLGLAIIKKIAELNKWEIKYTFCDHLHSFSVKF